MRWFYVRAVFYQSVNPNRIHSYRKLLICSTQVALLKDLFLNKSTHGFAISAEFPGSSPQFPAK